MGRMAYVGWAVLMASAILFSTLLGLGLGEWKGTSGRTRALLGLGLLLLLGSSVIAGYSGALQEKKPAAKTAGRFGAATRVLSSLMIHPSYFP